MAKKTFKPGEYAHGGLITVEATNTKIKIQFLDYQTKQPIGIERTFSVVGSRVDINMFVADNATSYYGDTVCEWLDTKVPDSKTFRYAGGSRFSIF